MSKTFFVIAATLSIIYIMLSTPPNGAAPARSVINYDLARGTAAGWRSANRADKKGSCEAMLENLRIRGELIIPVTESFESMVDTLRSDLEGELWTCPPDQKVSLTSVYILRRRGWVAR
jgi:hypothetical protein